MSIALQTLNTYPRPFAPPPDADTPEALARVLAMILVADAELDAEEVEALDRLDAYGRMGMPRARFMRVARDYCAELGVRMGERPWLSLSEIGPIDELLRGVTEADKRLLVARLAAAVIAADGRVEPIERRVYDHMLCRWGLSQRDVQQAIHADALN